MKIKLMILSVMILATLTGCETGTATSESKTKTASKVEIVLTPEEIADTNKNANIGAQLLVKKAILKEMETNKYTPEEQKELDSAIENLKMEFFLNRTASKKVVVTDEEVLSAYKENAEKLKDADIEIVFPQIKQEIFLLKVNQEKANYMNSLVEKYKLNDRIKEYYPSEKTQVKEEKVETPAPEEKKGA